MYWWNKDLEEFTTLYDYNAEIGDEWEIKVGTESITVHVDDVDVFEYNGETLKRMHISDAGNDFNGAIVVGVGHTTSFFPEELMAKYNFEVNGLRCYWVGDSLLYHQGVEECDAVYNNYHDVTETETVGFKVYPNPTDGTITVETVHAPSPQEQTEYRIINLMGQTLMTGSMSDTTIDVSTLLPGMYFLVFGEKTVKFVKQCKATIPK